MKTPAFLGILCIATLILPQKGFAGLFESKWRDATPEELAMTESSIDPDAGAEILIKECKIDNSEGYSGIIRNYSRIKVFNERGVAALQPVQIYIDEDREVSNLDARVIHPDGSIQTLDQKDVFSREVYRYGNVKFHSISFSFPGLTAGCIVECRWDEENVGLVDNVFFKMGGEFPVRDSIFEFKQYKKYTAVFNTFKITGPLVNNEKTGQWDCEMHNVPAVSDEPLISSMYGIQPWISVRYTMDNHQDKPADYWRRRSYWIWKTFKKDLDAGKRIVKKKALELTQGVDDPMERLKKIYSYCAHQIVNVSDSSSGYTSAEISKMRDEDDVGDTIKSGRGASYNIVKLFVSLAKAAGFETNYAFCHDKDIIEWSSNGLNYRMTPDLLPAVRVDNKWLILCPQEPLMPFGMLRDENEGTVAILGNKKKAEFAQTQMFDSSKSVLDREGTFTVDEDGSLDGTVVLTYTGHYAYGRRNELASLTPEEREKNVKENLTENLPAAEVSNIQIKNIDNPYADFQISYDVSVPYYADSTGSRLFIQPCFFQKGMKNVFSRSKREWDVRFPYLYEQHDIVRIAYPEDFTVEDGAAPESVLNSDTLAYTVQLGKSKNKNELVYRRNFKINGERIPVDYYKLIKEFYDNVYKQDNHVIALHTDEEESEDSSVPEEDANEESVDRSDNTDADGAVLEDEAESIL